MAVLTNGNLVKYKFLHNGQPLKHAYLNSTVKLWSAGNTVAYHVDNNATYTEEIEEGATCLSPKSFTPAKPGWTFVGWRADTTASGEVYTSLSMGSSPISLYAVFKAAVTVTYYNNSTNAGNATGYKYYNNGNTAAASFKLLQAGKSGWTARGWSASTAGNGGIAYNNNSAFTRDSNITLYGMYQQAVTLSYNGNGATGGSVAAQTGTRYYNSNGAYVNPSFTLKANAFTKTGYTFIKWALGSANGTQYAPGAGISVTGNTTMYAAWIADAFYAINPGGIINKSACPNAQELWGGYACGSASQDGKGYYGGYGHTDSTEEQWGCKTGNISTNGCKYVKIMPHIHIWAGKSLVYPLLMIYGDDKLIAAYGNPYYAPYPNNGEGIIHITNNKDTDRQEYVSPSAPLQVDVSKYNNISIELIAPSKDVDNCWVNIGLNYLQLYN